VSGPMTRAYLTAAAPGRRTAAGASFNKTDGSGGISLDTSRRAADNMLVRGPSRYVNRRRPYVFGARLYEFGTRPYDIGPGHTCSARTIRARRRSG
jgi:hypothetical protein